MAKEPNRFKLNLQKSRKVYYYIINEPSESDFTKTTAKKEIMDAIDGWQRVADLHFEEIPESKKDYSDQSFDGPIIRFEFGEVDDALKLAHCESRPHGGTLFLPQLITFNNKRPWTSMREKIDAQQTVPPDGVWATRSIYKIYLTVAAPFINDVFSVAMHEIGHALGLGHNDHPDSVMHAIGDLLDAPGSTVMMERGVPVVDAITLAEIYGSGIDKVEPLPPLDGGYVIVGGKFEMQNITSKTIAKPDMETCWGLERGHKILLASGYCWNSYLRATGYGRSYLYLMPPKDVDPNMLVVVGGFTIEGVGKPNSNDWQPREWDRVAAWGQSGPLEGQMFGHLYSLSSAADKEAYARFCFSLDHSTSGSLRVTGGQTTIGKANSTSRYAARKWGAYVDSKAGEIARGRTYSDRKGYGNAFSRIYLCQA